jgi:hypothetical protein
MAHGSHLGGSTGIPPDLLQQIIDAGLSDDRMGMAGQKARTGASLFGTPGAQGMNVGGTYKAASPLEHLSTAMSRILGGKMQRDAHGEMEGLLGQKAAGRRAMGQAQAGLFSPPTAEALNAPEPPAFAAPNFASPDFGLVDGVNETPARALARAMDERSRLGGIAALSGDPAIAASGQGLLADARTLGAQQFEGQQNKAKLLESRALREDERAFRSGERADERAWREEQANTDRSFREEQARLDRGARADAAQAARDAKPAPDMRAADDLRKELQNQQVYKDAQTVAAAFGKIKSASPTAAGDMGMVFGFMKILDPSSAVRETEYANAQNAGGVPEKIRNAYNKVLDGEFLTPEQRASFKREAEPVYGAQRKRYEDTAAQYKRLAEKRGLPAEDVVFDVFGGGGGGGGAPALTAEDQQAKTWAETNPNDPRAAEILKRLAAKGT